MKNRKSFQLLPGFVLAGTVGLLALSNGACSAIQNAEEAAMGCSAFPGSVSSLSLTGTAQAFVQSGADLVNIANTIENNVLTACINIDSDLMVTDTWSAMGPDGGGSLDKETTEACTQAANAISTALNDVDAGASAQCQLSISGGGCQVMADAEASCEAQCSGMASCTPPSVTASCSAGDISGQCSGMCMANATCEGSATVQAMCQGSCEADCTGMCTPPTGGSIDCTGSCTGNCNGTCTVNGTATQSTGTCSGTCSGKCDAACMIAAGQPAHCSGTCNGTCNGNCTITASGGVSCGAMANCRGACSGMVTAPTCEGQVKSAMCSSDVNCQSSCESHASLTANCTPPSVSLQCSASASSSLSALQMTLATNMPPLIEAVQTQGPLALSAANNLVSTGANFVGTLGSQSGTALACATAAAEASANATASVKVSVMASVSVSASAGGPTM